MLHFLMFLKDLIYLSPTDLMGMLTGNADVHQTNKNRKVSKRIDIELTDLEYVYFQCIVFIIFLCDILLDFVS